MVSRKTLKPRITLLLLALLFIVPLLTAWWLAVHKNTLKQSTTNQGKLNKGTRHPLINQQQQVSQIG